MALLRKTKSKDLRLQGQNYETTFDSPRPRKLAATLEGVNSYIIPVDKPKGVVKGREVRRVGVSYPHAQAALLPEHRCHKIRSTGERRIKRTRI